MTDREGIEEIVVKWQQRNCVSLDKSDGGDLVNTIMGIINGKFSKEPEMMICGDADKCDVNPKKCKHKNKHTESTSWRFNCCRVNPEGSKCIPYVPEAKPAHVCGMGGDSSCACKQKLFSVGDTVKIVKKISEPVLWSPSMDKTIGMTGVIERVPKSYDAVDVRVNNTMWVYNFSSLERVEEKPAVELPEGFEYCEINWEMGNYDYSGVRLHVSESCNVKNFAGFGFVNNGKVEICISPVAYLYDMELFMMWRVDATIKHANYVVFEKAKGV